MLLFVLPLVGIASLNSCSGKQNPQFGGGPAVTPTPLQFTPNGISWVDGLPKELPPVDVAGMQLVAECASVDKSEDNSSRLECATKIGGQYTYNTPIKHYEGTRKSGGSVEKFTFTKAQAAAGHEVAVLNIPLATLAELSKLVPVMSDPAWDTPEVIAATKGFALTPEFVAQAAKDDKEYLAGAMFSLGSDCIQGLAKTASGEWFCAFPDDPRIWPNGIAPERGSCEGQAVYRAGKETENKCAAISDLFVAEETACPSSVPTAGASFLVVTDAGACVRFARKSHR